MFAAELASDPMTPQPVIVMKIIQKSLHIDDSSTLQELLGRILSVRNSLRSTPEASNSIDSAGDLFTKYITRDSSRIENAKTFDEVRRILTLRGEDFLEFAKIMPVKIGRWAMVDVFQVHPNPVIITHSWNLSVLQACKEAIQRGYVFKVYVTEGQPRAEGDRMVRDLREAGVTAVKILDSSVAFYLDKSTFVMVGAEAVGCNGGVVARLGTATMAAVASALHKPTYVLSECYRLDENLKPLQGRSLPPQILYGPNVSTVPEDDLPTVDYTPPEHVTILITDVGPIYAHDMEECLESLFT